MSHFIINNVSLTRGYKPLLENIELKIEKKQRIALIGRNGVGKSSLIKLIMGEITHDSGTIERPQGYTIAALTQDLPKFKNQTVASWLSKDLTMIFADSWEYKNKIEQMAQDLKLDLSANLNSLSGGMIRRVLLGAALILMPDLLILDEPTNHLDIDTIQWLEEKVNSYPNSVLLVTHDRKFLENVANVIIELDRCKLTTYICSYDDYLNRKAKILENEAKQYQLFTKELQKEEDWIRQGVKARRTRNEGRVKRLEEMRKEYQQVRKPLGKSQGIKINSQLSGKLVLEVVNLSYTLNTKNIISPISFELMRGERLGIVGPNGCGKSTLIKLILGNISDYAGSIKLGTGLKIAYFDQHRELLDLNKTLYDNVGNGADYVSVNNHQVHVAGYLKKFLFNQEQFHQLVSTLSGGEKNRLMLAKLLASEFNFLILDEPTNDLDIETLELLENILLDFDGTLILISHDRSFINKSVTHLLVYENGKFIEFPGDYDAYKKYIDQKFITNKNKTFKALDNAKHKYNLESRNLQNLLKKISKIEQEIDELHTKLADPKIYSSKQDEMILIQKDLNEKNKLLNDLYTEWEKIEK